MTAAPFDPRPQGEHVAPDAGVRLRYTPDHPVLLFTDFPPDAGGGTNVIINSLLTADEKGAVVRASPSPPANPAALDRGSFVTLTRGSFGRSGGKSRSWFRDTFLYSCALADEVARLARERNAGRVWAVLHNAGVPVGYHLATRHRIGIHASVSDDPPYATALRSRKAFLLVPWIARVFGRTLCAATSVDAISDSMAERYRRKYGIESVIAHRGLSDPITPASTFVSSAGELSVGVLGNVYKYDQLPILGRAVAAAARGTGAKGRILVLGQGYGEQLGRDLAPLGVAVEYPGHVPEAEAVRRLGGCLAVYLNYPFGWRDRVLRETSFPVKLSTYLLTSRPVLFHGPAGTSIDGPLKIGGGGYIRHWPDMKPVTGAGILAEFWNDPAADEPWTAQAEALRAGYYDYATNRRNLIGALNRPG